jgi:hypothetical protein
MVISCKYALLQTNLETIGDRSLLTLLAQLSVKTTLESICDARRCWLEDVLGKPLSLKDPDGGAMSLSSIGGGEFGSKRYRKNISQ